MNDYVDMMPPPAMGGQSMMGGMSGISPPMHDSTIASMRWDAEQVKFQLYKMLGGYEVRQLADGGIEYYRPRGAPPPKINNLGIESIMSIILASVNPVVSLSNIGDDEANELIRQVLYGVVLSIGTNRERFQIDKGDMETIYNVVKIIVFTQVKRAVGGHESMNFRTQTYEQNMQQSLTQNQGGGFNILPFFNRRR